MKVTDLCSTAKIHTNQEEYGRWKVYCVATIDDITTSPVTNSSRKFRSLKYPHYTTTYSIIDNTEALGDEKESSDREGVWNSTGMGKRSSAERADLVIFSLTIDDAERLWKRRDIFSLKKRMLSSPWSSLGRGGWEIGLIFNKTENASTY